MMKLVSQQKNLGTHFLSVVFLNISNNSKPARLVVSTVSPVDISGLSYVIVSLAVFEKCGSGVMAHEPSANRLQSLHIPRSNELLHRRHRIASYIPSHTIINN
jgi:hypothetical protein